MWRLPASLLSCSQMRRADGATTKPHPGRVEKHLVPIQCCLNTHTHTHTREEMAPDEQQGAPWGNGKVAACVFSKPF